MSCALSMPTPAELQERLASGGVAFTAHQHASPVMTVEAQVRGRATQARRTARRSPRQQLLNAPADPRHLLWAQLADPISPTGCGPARKPQDSDEEPVRQGGSGAAKLTSCVPRELGPEYAPLNTQDKKHRCYILSALSETKIDLQGQAAAAGPVCAHAAVAFV